MLETPGRLIVEEVSLSQPSLYERLPHEPEVTGELQRFGDCFKFSY